MITRGATNTFQIGVIGFGFRKVLTLGRMIDINDQSGRVFEAEQPVIDRGRQIEDDAGMIRGPPGTKTVNRRRRNGNRLRRNAEAP